MKKCLFILFLVLFFGCKKPVKDHGDTTPKVENNETTIGEKSDLGRFVIGVTLIGK